MLTQFEKEKEKASADSGASSSSSSVVSADNFLQDTLKSLLAERIKLRKELREVQSKSEEIATKISDDTRKEKDNHDRVQQAKSASMGVNHFPESFKRSDNTEKMVVTMGLLRSRYTHIQTELALIQEDITSMLVATGAYVDNKAVDSNDNQEIKKFSDLKL